MRKANFEMVSHLKLRVECIIKRNSFPLYLFEYNPSISIYILCLSVCVFPINVKTAAPIGPKFCVGPHMTQGRFMNDQNFKILGLNFFLFL